MFHLRSTVLTLLKLKGIDGDLYKRWIMWFNAIVRAKSYQPLHFSLCVKIFFKQIKTSAAWLFSARVVRCQVNSCNGRNSCPVLVLKTSHRRCLLIRQGKKNDNKSLWPLWAGLLPWYNGKNKKWGDKVI